MLSTLLPAFAVHFVATALPFLAAILVAARLGVERVPVLLAIGLAATGAVAIVSFWAFYAAPVAGKSFACFVLLGSVLAIAVSLYGGKLERSLLLQIATPLGLWGLASLFLIYLGFMHGGIDWPLHVAATRFSFQLPSDNDIPRFYVEWFYQHGHHGTPPEFPGEWQFSDRPPLQVGYVLSQQPFVWGAETPHYQVLGVILQQAWIVGLWALLLAFDVSRVTRGLATVVGLVSDVAIVNGFFVWPKLLPVAMMLAAAALVISPLWPQLRREPWAGALVGALLGLALLAHGGSAFGVIPIAAVALIRGLPSWRWLAAALVAGAVLLVPWFAYQKYENPPGDRVTKWMLAGVPEVDDRSLSEAVVDSYGEAGLWRTLDNKLDNYETMLGGELMVEYLDKAADAIGDGDFAVAVTEVRAVFYFYLLPSLGLLLLAPLAMIAGRSRGRRRSAEWNLALACWAMFAIGAFAWGLIMFGNDPGRALIHQGSLLLPVLGFCGAVCGLRATFPRFATWFVGISAALMFALYIPVFLPIPESSFSPLAAVLAAVCLVGFGVTAFRGPAADPPPAA